MPESNWNAKGAVPCGQLFPPMQKFLEIPDFVFLKSKKLGRTPFARPG